MYLKRSKTKNWITVLLNAFLVLSLLIKAIFLKICHLSFKQTHGLYSDLGRRHSAREFFIGNILCFQNTIFPTKWQEAAIKPHSDCHTTTSTLPTPPYPLCLEIPIKFAHSLFPLLRCLWTYSFIHLFIHFFIPYFIQSLARTDNVSCGWVDASKI